ncbi:hypothetical protein E2R32_03820 [Rathayibacter toxicus]|nr:hypothetical protein AYW78_03865 [Rathayibacter toxicus]QOD11466.1 hypothetical protein BSG36_03895 [Rathayibacter toxicus]QWL27062.1 hypothetical protein E2R32_03820 [Rathayibacter toxicus]QWL29187.1 hypothetical protein E2R33_03900 [Rathayibacter toxicus]QWL31279.1 hypothetical protein E2R34_03815 [Rathayibacter toxicus]
MVGGCCRVGPSAIAALHQAVTLKTRRSHQLFLNRASISP